MVLVWRTGEHLQRKVSHLFLGKIQIMMQVFFVMQNNESYCVIKQRLFKYNHIRARLFLVLQIKNIRK